MHETLDNFGPNEYLLKEILKFKGGMSRIAERA